MKKPKNTVEVEKNPPLEKLAFRPREFQRAFGIAKSYFYEQVSAGLKSISNWPKSLVLRQYLGNF